MTVARLALVQGLPRYLDAGLGECSALGRLKRCVDLVRFVECVDRAVE
jgi:hypothetical protein